jgi:hypothetical protein
MGLIPEALFRYATARVHLFEGRPRLLGNIPANELGHFASFVRFTVGTTKSYDAGVLPASFCEVGSWAWPPYDPTTYLNL